MTRRAVIYARYSSDNQRDASIDDQVRQCRQRLEHEVWSLTEMFTDPAISGATTSRPGYQAMLALAERGGFDVLVAEALDRLSRDLADVATLHKRLSFHGIEIVTLSEGQIGDLHVGLKGTMNALFLKDLAQKTRRGLQGRIEAGHSAGGISYGYDLVRRIGADGDAVRGERSINEAEAAIVRRVFAMFADGLSPIAIARNLNKEEMPGPRGLAWRDTTIRGHAARGTGILRNELYVGRLVWNRLRYVKDPATGKRVSRPNDRPAIQVVEVPGLRIIDDAIWDRVQLRLSAIRSTSGADNPDRVQFWENRRPRHVLTGRVFCGCCGGAMSNIGKEYLACTAARRQGICDNQRGVRRSELEARVLDALKSRLMRPEHVATFVAEFTTEWNRLLAESNATRGEYRRELDVVERRLNNLVDAIADGLRSDGLRTRLDDLERRRSTLRERLETATVAAPALHPNLAGIYRQRVETLEAALRSGDDNAALEAVRALIERVIIHPTEAGQGYEIEVIGEISAMLRLSSNGNTDGPRASPVGVDHDLFARSVKVVAGTRNRRSHHSTVPI